MRCCGKDCGLCFPEATGSRPKSRATVAPWELGEDEAVRFLKTLGYRILARQMRNSFGEIDIIAEDRSVIVFVEVKTRTDESGGKPWEAVNQKRQERMTRCSCLAEEDSPSRSIGTLRCDFHSVARHQSTGRHYPLSPSLRCSGTGPDVSLARKLSEFVHMSSWAIPCVEKTGRLGDLPEDAVRL